MWSESARMSEGPGRDGRRRQAAIGRPGSGDRGDFVTASADWDALPGRLIVVSGPSGSGKSTLVRRALERPGVQARLSVSATTRPPRPGEGHGREYLFMS